MGNKIHRFFSNYVGFAQRHLAIVIMVILATAAVSIFFAAKLQIKSDLKELLPEDYSSVKELNKALERIGGVGSLIVTAQSPDPAANKRFMDDLADRLNALPPGSIRYLDYKSDEVKHFYEKYFLYYINPPDLDALYDAIQRRIDYEKLKTTRLFIDFADEDPLTVEIDDIKDRNQKNYSSPVQTFENYYGGEWGRFLIMIIRPFDTNLSVERARRMVSAVEQQVAGLQPESYSSDMEVGYCGNVKSTLEEYDTLKGDILSTALLCVTLVAGIIIVFFLRVRIVFLLGITLIVALSWTFALTYFFIGYLNSQTAFLGSIILGTGINYGIILMGRYIEERKKKRAHLEAMKHAVEQTISPTFLAAATTAVAFIILLVAQIRGLSQFGLIGAIGVMLCWVATYFVFPVITLASEKVWNMVKVSHASARRSAVFAILTRWAVHSPARILAVSFAVVIISIVAIVQFVPNSIEYDFTKMRNKTSVASGTEALEKRVSKFFKDSMTPAVVLVDKMEDAPKVCDAVNRQNMALPEADRRVGSCYSIYSLLPKDQELKLGKLERFKELLDDNEEFISKLKGDLKDKVDEIKKSLGGKFLTLDDIPASLTRHFEDLQHNKGVVVFINPRAGMLLSDGRNLIKFAGTIKDITLGDGRVFHAAGASLIFSDLVTAIRDEAPILTLASFICVLIFVGIVVRRWRASWVIVISLAFGITAMLGLVSFLKMKLNFFNFIALPLTFGIGVDYAINIVLRLAKEDAANIEHALRHTGLAVILCSLTTIIGYSVLIVANNQALASFGWIAIIGEVTCISAAILLAPALVVLFRNKQE